VETIVWGFPNSSGVFLDAYLRDPTYSTQPHAYSLLPLIGTLANGILYLSGEHATPHYNVQLICKGPFTYPFMYRYPKWRHLSLWVGAIISWASLFAASYSTKVRQDTLGDWFSFNPRLRISFYAKVFFMQLEEVMS
jgi:MFS transporter, MCT family, solute carrier family 16 (monocarboxylic acid transporters), member 10